MYNNALKRVPFILAVALQVVVLAMLPSSKYKAVETGITVFLKVGPVDPYDFLSGYHVLLDYEIGHPEGLDDLTDLVRELPIFVTIKQGDDGLWHVARVMLDPPELLEASELLLRGTYLDDRVRYGIESYFISEDVREEVEKNLRENPDSARAEVKIDPETGIAAVVALHIAGKIY
ncbi:MAG: GDYXXLXY domain-containing protein [Candidatus Poribacteria bacterium]|nr:GDYXXLXY domain-containing protein [Candidatus Poribacteria bacterium]